MRNILTNEEIEARVACGVKLFKSGYNCAHAVKDTLKMAVSFEIAIYFLLMFYR